MAGSKSRIGASTDAATDGVTRVEIITRGEPRREYTSAQRAEILTEAALPGARALTVAQRHGISPSLVYRWRREAAGRPAQKSRSRAARFVPLLVEDSGPAPGLSFPAEATNLAPEADRVEVLLRNGRLLRFSSTTDPDGVARLAAALER
ncbi:transposase [Dankookia sp. GCM10030260]|uniref:IS66-like element accessory protein TnpA n=1 Tax=Dankookia sp. GCM10030260 TaxID=3273390 RepID=UPI00360CB4F4